MPVSKEGKLSHARVNPKSVRGPLKALRVRASMLVLCALILVFVL